MIGNSIKIFDELESTNDFVKMNVSNLEHGTIIVAKSQTLGRGRRDNIWVSKVGNLYFSIILKDDVDRQSIFKYIVVSSLAIVRSLKVFNIAVSIKYPNDCLVAGKKISGILIESLGSTKLDYMIIGIGININQIKFDELSDKATSIKLLTKMDINIENVLDEFVRNYNEILNMDFNEVFNMYLSYSMVINKKIIYHGEEYIISNIEKDGTIIIKNEVSEHRVSYNEISLKEFY